MAPTYAPTGPLPKESQSFPVAAIVVLAIVGYILLFIIGIIIRKCIITKGDNCCPTWFSELCQCQTCCATSDEPGCLSKCAENCNWNVPSKRRCMDSCCPTKQRCDDTFCGCFSQQPEGECCKCDQCACGECGDCGDCFECPECKECCDDCKCECCAQPETIDCCCIEWHPWCCDCRCKFVRDSERRGVDDMLRFLDNPTATKVFRENASLIRDKIQNSPLSRLDMLMQGESSILPNSSRQTYHQNSPVERVSRVYTMQPGYSRNLEVLK